MHHPRPVSVHGGHSGQFCGHAKDCLEDIIRTYIDHGYLWVGITEHMPPVSDDFIYPEERAAGLDAGALRARFADYIATCRRLQAKYAPYIRIYVGFETETCSGSPNFIEGLIRTFTPDYTVGSVHHVNDIPFDYSQGCYDQAVDCCGGPEALYLAYFDQQYEMIRALAPRVVGHLDIIRIYDSDYRSRLVRPVIWAKILRNLKLIRHLGLILDYNVRPLYRGDSEPYPFGPIFEKAAEMGIAVVPGDDSHGVHTIGVHMHDAIERLQAAGVNTNWVQPVPNHWRWSPLDREAVLK